MKSFRIAKADTKSVEDIGVLLIILGLVSLVLVHEIGIPITITGFVLFLGGRFAR